MASTSGRRSHALVAWMFAAQGTHRRHPQLEAPWWPRSALATPMIWLHDRSRWLGIWVKQHVSGSHSVLEKLDYPSISLWGSLILFRFLFVTFIRFVMHTWISLNLCVLKFLWLWRSQRVEQSTQEIGPHLVTRLTLMLNKQVGQRNILL